MINSRFAQVGTFDFELLPDQSRHAGSIDLFDLLFRGLDTPCGPMAGRYRAPVQLSVFTIALRKRSSRPAGSFTA